MYICDKENKIKVGDKVRVSKDAPKMYVDGMSRIFVMADSEVEAVCDDNAKVFVETDDALHYLVIPCKYLVKVEDEIKTDPASKSISRIANL